MNVRRNSKRWIIVAVSVAGIASLVGWQLKPGAESENAIAGRSAAPAARATDAHSTIAGSTSPFGSASPATNHQKLIVWQQRFLRAEQVYSSYKEATRFPPDSRPLDEHADQLRPFLPISEEVPLRDASGKPVNGLHIRTTQDKVFVAGAESARFTIAAFDDHGRSVPLVVEQSHAQSIPDTTALVTLIRTEVAFSDNGMGADESAGDGRYSGRLAPAEQGFAKQPGTIRLLVQLNAGGRRGVVAFDVVYTPAVPATWAGVREAMDGGSLNFYLKAQINTAGRYVASARVFDAHGTPLALLQFNEEVAAGPAEFKLTLAGLLVRERNPAFPLRLVDVEGFLLRPDTFPDRAMMPRLSGDVYTSNRYAAANFSDAEWQSEERVRYLAEYGRDMERAQAEMAKLRQR